MSPGEITFSALAELAGALDVLAVLLARHLTDRDGAGRTPAVVERAAELRLRGLGPGSTVLEMSVGEDGVLGDGLEHRTRRRPLRGLRRRRSLHTPAWITPGIGEATVAVLDVLGRAASECELVGDRHGRVRVTPRSAMRAPWTIARVPDRSVSALDLSRQPFVGAFDDLDDGVTDDDIDALLAEVRG